MADLSKSLDSLVANMGEMVRREISSGLRPVLRKLSEAVAELESKLDAAEAASGKKRRGRPAGSGAKKTARAGARKGGTRSPRGALQQVVRDVLGASGKPMKLSEIRDGVLKDPVFKGRDPKTLYTMIVFAVKKMPEVKKTAGGLYGVGSKGGARKKKA